MKKVPWEVSINSWLLFAGTGVTVGSTVRQKARKAVHAGLFREIIPRMVNSTKEKGPRDQRATSSITWLPWLMSFPLFPTLRWKAKDLKNFSYKIPILTWQLDLRSSQAYVQQHQNLLLMLWCELQLWGRACCTTNGQAEDVVYRLLVCDPWALLPCGHGGHHSQQTKYWSGRGVALTPRNTA